MRYVRSLDGLRAIAILLVMGVHYHESISGGWVGVQLFFVISGFLITRGLLELKDRHSFKHYLGWFYLRRALRIFPLYFGYIVLLAVLLVSVGVATNFRYAWPWLWSYSLNFGQMLHRVPIDDWYSHFWSLALEEQFYLVWPFLIWYLSRVAICRLCIVMIGVAPVLRAAWMAYGAVPDQLYYFPLTQMDAFAVGAILTFVHSRVEWSSRALLWAGGVTLGLGVLINAPYGWRQALISMGQPYYLPHAYQYVWGYSLINICAALAVMGCVSGRLRFLESSLLVRIGQISYGIYVFHRPLIGVLDRKLPLLTVSGWFLGVLSVLLYLGLSYLIALCSYRWYESRFLRLKDRWAPV